MGKKRSWVNNHCVIQETLNPSCTMVLKWKGFNICVIFVRHWTNWKPISTLQARNDLIDHMCAWKGFNHLWSIDFFFFLHFCYTKLFHFFFLCLPYAIYQIYDIMFSNFLGLDKRGITCYKGENFQCFTCWSVIVLV